MGDAEVAGEEDVPSGFESEAQAGIAGGEGVPLAVGEGDGELADAIEHAGVSLALRVTPTLRASSITIGSKAAEA